MKQQFVDAMLGIRGRLLDHPAQLDPQVGRLIDELRTAHAASSGIEVVRENGAYEDEDGQIKRFDGPREKALEREVEELRERVKVLERIATDGRETRLLSDEIEKLRDN